MQRRERDIDIGSARCWGAREWGLQELHWCVRGVQVHADVSCGDTIVTRKQRKVCRMSWDRWLAAHVVMVVALGRRWRHKRWRWRQTWRPPPRAARERVHGGERADVAHARGALAAGRLRPLIRSLLLPPTSCTARALRSPPALRVLPSARPHVASLCFEFLIYYHSSCFHYKYTVQNRNVT